MRTLVLVGCLMALLGFSGSGFAQSNSDEVGQLRQRVAELEKQVQELTRIIEPIKAQQAAENRQKALREKFEKKMAEDRTKYTPQQLREAERLYQIANQKWGSDEALKSLQTMIGQYPDINRTGCAVLYVAQQSNGEERAGYLKQCIEKHNDCFYGDGVQVGAYARFLMASDQWNNGDHDRANVLFAELKNKFADAVDHGGKLLIDAIPKEEK